MQLFIDGSSCPGSIDRKVVNSDNEVVRVKTIPTKNCTLTLNMDVFRELRDNDPEYLKERLFEYFDDIKD